MSRAIDHPNFRSPAAQMLEAQSVDRRLLENAPIGILLLTPDLRIVDANEHYLSDVGMARAALAGVEIFEAFPDSPHHPGADGVRNLRSSFETVLHNGRAHVMRLQR